MADPPPPPPPGGGPPPPPPPSQAAAPASVEVLDLNAESLASRREHELLLIDLEAKKRAFQIDVPTLANDVRDALRRIGQPVRLFGENPAEVRDRLRMELARREVMAEGGAKVESAAGLMPPGAAAAAAPAPPAEEEREVTKYTRAEPELIDAREDVAKFSLVRARARLDRERRRRESARMRGETNGGGGTKRPLSAVAPENGNGDASEGGEEDELGRLNSECLSLYRSVHSMCLEGSQFGDARPLSAVCASSPPPGYAAASVRNPCLIATGGWSGAVRLWNGSSSTLDPLATKSQGHEDRIMGVAMRPILDGESAEEPILATASIDLTGKLWRVTRNDDVAEPMEEDDGDGGEEGKTNGQKSKAAATPDPYSIEELATLRGHEARLCRVAFHPSGRYVATTSFDHTWRLWDVESGGTQLLLQDGHWKETYGVGMHPDGSLCATTDFGGTVQVWDLRTGKSACHFAGGHAKRVLCSEFAPNGFQLATAGDDGTLKIWDLRRKATLASVPAHSRLVTQVRFCHDVPGQNGEFVVTSSFDGTVKVWSTRDWRMLSTLRGHEGKVMGVDVLSGPEGTALVSSGYDKTLKLWK